MYQRGENESTVDPMDDLRREIEALGEDLPGLLSILKTLGLGLLNEHHYRRFLHEPIQSLFPVFRDAVFWEPKIEEGNLLAGMNVTQIQSQTKTLAHMVVRLASHDQTCLQWEPDIGFSPLQNSYLLLIVLGMDALPVGALRPFEPWDVVEMGYLCDIHDRVLSHTEQSSLVRKLEFEHHQLRCQLPITCAPVDLCVGADLFPIFCILSEEQQDRVVINNGILRDASPVLRKFRRRAPLFLVTLYLEVVDNTTSLFTKLFIWEFNPVGVLMKELLMASFQEPDISSEEMCLILTALLALSDIFLLGRDQTSERDEFLVAQPYEHPPISEFHEWVQDPSRLHLGWRVIHTLICSFQARYAPIRDGTALPAMYALMDSIKPAIKGTPVPESYDEYWERRDICSRGTAHHTLNLADAKEVMDKKGSKEFGARDFMGAVKHVESWRRQFADLDSDEHSPSTPECPEEHLPAYTSYSPQDPVEDPARMLGVNISLCSSAGPIQDTARKSWLRKLCRRVLERCNPQRYRALYDGKSRQDVQGFAALGV